jgi:hypothetical protein
MTNVRDYDQIDDLLGDPSRKVRQIEENLAKLPENQLALINDGLQFLDTDQDRYREWREQLAKGHYTTMHSELLMVSHFRRKLGYDAVTLSKPIPGSGKDFDTVVEWDGTEFWIEVLKPEFANRLQEGEVGFIGWNWIPDSVERKLESDFEPARENLPGDAVLILAVYAEQINHVGLSLTRWLKRADYPVGKYCDAFFEYTHLAGETSVSVREFTDNGVKAQSLIDEIADDV